jgi:hypothetical protein
MYFVYQCTLIIDDSAAASSLKESQEIQMNQFIADEVATLVKSRFDTTLADKLMDEVVCEPEWLVNMMKKPQVRHDTRISSYENVYE